MGMRLSLGSILSKYEIDNETTDKLNVELSKFEEVFIDAISLPDSEAIEQLIEEVEAVKNALCMEDLGAYANGYCTSMRDGLDKAIKRFRGES